MITQISSEEYRHTDEACNSDLQLIEIGPSEYQFAKKAPVDMSKTSALDYGSALHLALLEPDTFNDKIDIYTDTKTRETVKFHKYMDEKTDDKLVLLEAEYDKLRLTVEGSKYHPQFNYYIENATHKESSVFTEYRGVKCKIRPDLMRLDGNNCVFLGDVKTTHDIEDWRNKAEWRNPLFTHNYGFTAAFYMDVLSAELGVQVDEYKFLVVNKSIDCGRYPVSVFTIHRDELERYGFFERVYLAIDAYKECMRTGNWMSEELFPLFRGDDMIISVEDEGE